VDSNGGVNIGGKAVTNSRLNLQGQELLPLFDTFHGSRAFVNQLFPVQLDHMKIQNIPTNNAWSAVTFSISSARYLAVASRTGAGAVMRWNATVEKFQGIQSIYTLANEGVAFFAIGADSFLALASTGGSGPSRVLRWDGTIFQDFINFTQASNDYELFSVGSSQNYLIEARVGDTARIRSWDGSGFNTILQILTPSNNAQDVEHSVINGVDFIAVSNAADVTIFFSSNSSGAPSFQMRQIIPAAAPSDTKFFNIASKDFLAVAESGGATSTIYKYNTNTGRFDPFDTSISSQGARGWKYFQILGADYLALANSMADSQIFRWTGQAFAAVASVQTSGATEWEYFNNNGVDYLFVANSGTNSFLYRLTPY